MRIYCGTRPPTTGYEDCGLQKEPAIEGASCTEILADEVLDYIHTDEFESYVTNLVAKLRHGGTIVIGGIELIETLKATIRGQITESQYNEFVFGAKGTKRKSGCHSLPKLVELLQNLGLKVQKKKIEKNRMVVEATRL